MLPLIQLDPQEETPIYRQVYEHIKSAIYSREVESG